jgi:tetratricopeptide (TPR) repeat protein
MTLGSAGFLVGLRLATYSPGAEKLIRQGQTALNHGDYDRAEILFTHAMQFPESSCEAQYRRGVERALKGDRYWAIDDFLAVREKMPDPRLDALVGYTYQLMQRYGEALDWYRHSVGNGYSQWQLWVNMGHVAMNQNLPGDARRYLDRAEKAGADGPEYFYARLLSESWKHDLSERSARQLAYWAGRLDRYQFTGPDAHADLARALVRPGELSVAGLATASSHLKTAIYQGADVRDLARDPQLRDLFEHDPGLFQVDTGTHQGSCPEPIPDLYNTILIEAEELRSGSQQKKEKTRRKN